MQLKTLTISVATAALMATGAMAQNNTGPAKPATPPAATSPSNPSMAKPAAPAVTPKAPETTQATPKASEDQAANPANAGSIEFASSAPSDGLAASKLMGMKVKNSSGDSLGDINDIIVDSKGKPSVAVIGVGGFLGIGEKNVGVPFEKLQIAMNQNNTRVARLDVSKSTLESAPNFVYQDNKSAEQAVKTK